MISSQKKMAASKLGASSKAKKMLQKVDKEYENIKQELSSKARKKRAAQERGEEPEAQFES